MNEILCFLYDGFADFETVLTCSALNEAEDYKVTYIAYEKTPVYSSGGLKINPDKTVSEIDGLKEIVGLIIPGGGTRIFKPELEKLIKKVNDEKKLVAAICAGPEYLAKSGILNGKKYTTSADPQSYKEEKLEDPFPRDTYIETRIVQDGNIITAQGYAFTDFALKIWEYFDLYENEQEKEELRKQLTPS
ncbi:MAG: DJ-1/PfpI family protein [Promethearchaeota archaeon]|nr:MAG: DJ-1/PfpI family protein [Candidatus Lokiarchaeota archaeon]